MINYITIGLDQLNYQVIHLPVPSEGAHVTQNVAMIKTAGSHYLSASFLFEDNEGPMKIYISHISNEKVTLIAEKVTSLEKLFILFRRIR